MSITLRIDGNSRFIVVFEEVRSYRTFGPKSAQRLFLDVTASFQLLEFSHNPKYDNFLH